MQDGNIDPRNEVWTPLAESGFKSLDLNNVKIVPEPEKKKTIPDGSKGSSQDSQLSPEEVDKEIENTPTIQSMNGGGIRSLIASSPLDQDLLDIDMKPKPIEMASDNTNVRPKINLAGLFNTQINPPKENEAITAFRKNEVPVEIVAKAYAGGKDAAIKDKGNAEQVANYLSGKEYDAIHTPISKENTKDISGETSGLMGGTASLLGSLYKNIARIPVGPSVMFLEATNDFVKTMMGSDEVTLNPYAYKDEQTILDVPINFIRSKDKQVMDLVKESTTNTRADKLTIEMMDLLGFIGGLMIAKNVGAKYGVETNLAGMMGLSAGSSGYLDTRNEGGTVNESSGVAVSQLLGGVVQGLVLEGLGKFTGDIHASLLKDLSKYPKGALISAGVERRGVAATGSAIANAGGFAMYGAMGNAPNKDQFLHEGAVGGVLSLGPIKRALFNRADRAIDRYFDAPNSEFLGRKRITPAEAETNEKKARNLYEVAKDEKDTKVAAAFRAQADFLMAINDHAITERIMVEHADKIKETVDGLENVSPEVKAKMKAKLDISVAMDNPVYGESKEIAEKIAVAERNIKHIEENTAYLAPEKEILIGREKQVISEEKKNLQELYADEKPKKKVKEKSVVVPVASKKEYSGALQKVMGLTKEVADAHAALADFRAQKWASETGKKPEEWYSTTFDKFQNQESYVKNLAKEKNISIEEARKQLEQGGENAGEADRGAVSFDKQAKATITLFKGADASTVVHEALGHTYFEQRIQDRENNPVAKKVLDDVVADYNRASGEGVKVEDLEVSGSDAYIKVHEYFASGFETWLKEGQRAPDTKMQKVYEDFKKWMLEIYKAVAPVAPVSESMNKVYEEMMGTKPSVEAVDAMLKDASSSNDIPLNKIKDSKNEVIKQELDIRLSSSGNDIIKELNDNGQKALIIGGAVRDNLLGKDPKDIDIEVYNINYKDLNTLLSKYGKTSLVGKAFGIIKFTDKEGNEYDFSLPRRESKIGVGHKGFEVNIDESMTPKEAAERRDFTWNGLAYDPILKEIHDYYGGINDLKNGVIRHTSDKFKDDPLRILRAMQFQARMGMKIDASTMNLMKTMVQEGAMKELPLERVSEEWMKWATKGKNPEKLFEFLEGTGLDVLLPHISEIKGVKQDVDWHPEGDVRAHTVEVIKSASEIADREKLKGDDRAALMFSALTHDLAKSNTSETSIINGKERITSKGHEKAGGKFAKDFLESIGIKQSIIDRVVPLVENHLEHVNIFSIKERRGQISAIKKLSVRLGDAKISELINLIEADASGRPPIKKGIPESALKLKEMASEIGVSEKPEPDILMGKDLIAIGIKPSLEFGNILRAAKFAQEDGGFNTKEGAKKWLLDYVKDKNISNEELKSPTPSSEKTPEPATPKVKPIEKESQISAKKATEPPAGQYPVADSKGGEKPSSAVSKNASNEGVKERIIASVKGTDLIYKLPSEVAGDKPRKNFASIEEAKKYVKMVEDAHARTKPVASAPPERTTLFQGAKPNEERKITVNGKELSVKQLPEGLEIKNGFYSPIEKKILETQKESQTAEQWLNDFGRTKDETVYTGLAKFLGDKKPKEMVSKEDVRNYLRDNRIEIVEVVKEDKAKKLDEIAATMFGGKYSELKDWQAMEVETEWGKHLREKDATKFKEYQLEGSKSDYKEVLILSPGKNPSSDTDFIKIAHELGYKIPNTRDGFLSLPSDVKNKIAAISTKRMEDGSVYNEKNKQFQSSHFDEPNILVHLRMNIRENSEGKKTLFLEEVQSDWGQQGKRKGFVSSLNEIKELPKNYTIDKPTQFHDWQVVEPAGVDGNLQSFVLSDGKTKEEAINVAIRRLNVRQSVDKTPTAPYVTNTTQWVKLGLKTAMQHAVKSGAKFLSWTTGEQQNDRYDLSKQVESITFTPEGNYDINKQYNGEHKGYPATIRMYPLENNSRPIVKVVSDVKELSDVIGKDLAKRMDAGEWDIRGGNLKIGGSGMIGFYGSPLESKLGIVGEVAESLWGKGSVKTTEIDTEAEQTQVRTFDNARDAADFREELEENAIEHDYSVTNEGKVKITYQDPIGYSQQHSIEITPEIEANVKQGQPLFQGAKPKAVREYLDWELENNGEQLEKTGKYKITREGGEKVLYVNGKRDLSHYKTFADAMIGAERDHVTTQIIPSMVDNFKIAMFGSKDPSSQDIIKWTKQSKYGGYFFRAQLEAIKWLADLGGEEKTARLLSKWIGSKKLAARLVAHAANSIVQNITRTQSIVDGTDAFFGAVDRAKSDPNFFAKKLYNLIDNDGKSLRKIHEVIDPQMYADWTLSEYTDYVKDHVREITKGDDAAKNAAADNIDMEAVQKDYEGRRQVLGFDDPTNPFKPVTYDDLSPTEKMIHDIVRNGLDIIHETSFSNGSMDIETYTKNKGKYTPRLYDKFEAPEDVSREVMDLGNRVISEIYKKQGALDFWKTDHAIADPVYIFAKRYSQVMANKALIDYGKWLIKEDVKINGNMFSSQNDIKGYVKMGKGYGQLSGRNLREDIAEDFKGVYFTSAMLNNFYLGIDEYSRWAPRQFLKKVVTVYAPAVQMGNFTGNIVFASLMGINPARYLKNYYYGYKQVDTYGADYRYLLDRGVMNPGGNFEEIRNSVSTLKSIMKEAETSDDPAGFIDILKSGVGVLPRGLEYVYQNVDQWGKMAAFKSLVELGIHPEEAARRVADGFQNLRKVGKAYTIASKLPLMGQPFARFSGDLVRILGVSAIKNPLNLVTFLATLQGMQHLASYLFDETEEERRVRIRKSGIPFIPLPAWAGGDISLSFKLGRQAVNLARFVSPMFTYAGAGGESDYGRVLLKLAPWYPDVAPPVNSKFSFGPNDPEYVDFIKMFSKDILPGTAVQWVFDSDFMGNSTQDNTRDRYNKEGSKTGWSKAAVSLNYLARGYIPYWNMINDIYLSGKFNEDYYGRKKSVAMSIFRYLGYNAEIVDNEYYDKIISKDYKPLLQDIEDDALHINAVIADRFGTVESLKNTPSDKLPEAIQMVIAGEIYKAANKSGDIKYITPEEMQKMVEAVTENKASSEFPQMFSLSEKDFKNSMEKSIIRQADNLKKLGVKFKTDESAWRLKGTKELVKITNLQYFINKANEEKK